MSVDTWMLLGTFGCDDRLISDDFGRLLIGGHFDEKCSSEKQRPRKRQQNAAARESDFTQPTWPLVGDVC